MTTLHESDIYLTRRRVFIFMNGLPSYTFSVTQSTAKIGVTS